MVLGFAFWALLGQAGECPVLLQAARNAYNTRKYDDAVAEFQQAHAACGQPQVTLLPLAQAQLLAQRPEASLQTLQTLLKLQPENLDALKLQGDILYVLGRVQEAEKSLKSVLEVDGSHAGAQYALGRIYYQQNRFVEAIARSTEACLALPVPMVAAIVGEGGSGGAVALASAERVLMFEHAVYSVISPEGCASILWRTAEKAPQAAEAMKMTAQDLAQLGVIDRIVPEPTGGAHRDPATAAKALGNAIGEEIDALSTKTSKQLRRLREDRFLAMGEPRKGRKAKD